MTQYKVGITRKNNKRIGNWVAEDGFTYNENEAKLFDSREEAAKVARQETGRKWRGVVQPA